MKTLTPRARVTQTMWSRSTGYHYTYAFEHVPWISAQCASDVEHPDHVRDAVAVERDRHVPVTLKTDGESMTLYPHIEHWIMESLPGGRRYTVYVYWYDNPEGTGNPIHTSGYEIDHGPEFGETHEAHIASIEQQIPVRLHHDETRPHDLGSGPITEARR